MNRRRERVPWHPPYPIREQVYRKVCFRASISTAVSCRGSSGLMSRRTVAWLCATEVIHVCKACSSAVGFHQGGESGRIVSDVVSVVVSIPFVSRIVVFLLAKSLAS